MRCALAALLVLTGCSGSMSTLKQDGRAYAVTRQQAKEIVDSAILAYISPDYVNPAPAGSLTSSGYIRSIIDTCTINATAFPVRGLTAQGKAVDGYGFLVAYRGTIAFPATPGQVYAFIKESAARKGAEISAK